MLHTHSFIHVPYSFIHPSTCYCYLKEKVAKLQNLPKSNSILETGEFWIRKLPLSFSVFKELAAPILRCRNGKQLFHLFADLLVLCPTEQFPSSLFTHTSCLFTFLPQTLCNARDIAWLKFSPATSYYKHTLMIMGERRGAYRALVG
jgi:hypothetical protein